MFYKGLFRENLFLSETTSDAFCYVASSSGLLSSLFKIWHSSILGEHRLNIGVNILSETIKHSYLALIFGK